VRAATDRGVEADPGTGTAVAAAEACVRLGIRALRLTAPRARPLIPRVAHGGPVRSGPALKLPPRARVSKEYDNGQTDGEMGYNPTISQNF